MDRKREYIAQVPAPPGGRHGRIVNQVRILNGTAAVYGEAAHRDESPSLGNREDRAPLLIRQSEDLLAAMLSPLRAIRRRIDSIAGNRPRQCLLARFFCKPERGTAAAFHGGGQEQPLPPAPLPYVKFAGKRL